MLSHLFLLSLKELQLRVKSVSSYLVIFNTTIFNIVRRKPASDNRILEKKVKEEDLDDEGTEGITDLTGIQIHVEPKDGEYSSFPEVHRKTVDKLKACDYKNLFPI
jgi:hypothetical protein